MAADTASVAAPGTPALSKSGANANPVAGPPVSVTEPASTPNSGCSPSAIATTAPTTFCSTAATDASTIIAATSGPPRRSRRTLAPKPTDAKNDVLERRLQRRVEGQRLRGRWYRAAPGWPQRAGRRRRVPECCSG